MQVPLARLPRMMRAKLRQAGVQRAKRFSIRLNKIVAVHGLFDPSVAERSGSTTIRLHIPEEESFLNPP